MRLDRRRGPSWCRAPARRSPPAARRPRRRRAGGSPCGWSTAAKAMHEDDEDPGDAEQLLIHETRPSPGRAYQTMPCVAAVGGFVQQFQRFVRRRRRPAAGCAAAATGSRCRVAWSMKLDQPVPEAVDVEQAERLGVIAERVPAPRLEQFVERADPAGQRDEGVGSSVIFALRSCMLATCGARSGRCARPRVDQRLRDHAIDLAAGLEHRCRRSMPIRPSRPPP